jgi:hypothetical protein
LFFVTCIGLLVAFVTFVVGRRLVFRLFGRFTLINRVFLLVIFGVWLPLARRRSALRALLRAMIEEVFPNLFEIRSGAGTRVG